jgi:hypothetical protein
MVSCARIDRTDGIDGVLQNGLHGMQQHGALGFGLRDGLLGTNAMCKLGTQHLESSVIEFAQVSDQQRSHN